MFIRLRISGQNGNYRYFASRRPMTDIKSDEKQNSLRSLKPVNKIFTEIVIKFINYLHKVCEYAEILKKTPCQVRN